MNIPMQLEDQRKMTPQLALEHLQQGNRRFVDNEMTSYDMTVVRLHNRRGQYPLAVVLSCIDSRCAPELVFDQPPGNIFVTRVAGNIVTDEILASIEFATAYAGAKLIVVLGHQSCGAVAAACEGDASGRWGDLLANIEPAIHRYRESSDAKGEVDEVDEIAKVNVNEQTQRLRLSDTIDALIKDNQVMMVGAMHNVSTGKVEFYS